MECHRKWKNQRELIHIIRERIRTKREKRNARINKNKTGITFQIGDLVLVKACPVSNATIGKVATSLELYEGPYQIKKRIAMNTYLLANKDTARERGQYHVIDLKPYLQDPCEEVGRTNQSRGNL